MIEIRNCSKAFGEIHAIDHVSMEIGERQTALAAVVNALNEFWYLFSRDKVDFYHSLPVTKSGQRSGAVSDSVCDHGADYNDNRSQQRTWQSVAPGSGKNVSGAFVYVSAALFRSSAGTGGCGKYSGRHSVIMLRLFLRTCTGNPFMGAGNDVFQNKYGT